MAGRIVGWRVWYDGGRRYDSRLDSWDALPAVGFQIYVAFRDSGVASVGSGADFYYVRRGPSGELIVGGDSIPLDPDTDEPLSTAGAVRDAILARHVDARVRVGTWQSDAAMNAQLLEAQLAVSRWIDERAF